MADLFLNFTKKVDRRSPHTKGDPDSPYERINLLSRDGRLSIPKGTQRVLSSESESIFTWGARYHTTETGVISPKTFTYSVNGKLWHIDELAQTATEIKASLNENAYPKSWMFKTGNQNNLFLVDESNLYRYDGNNDYTFSRVGITDTSGDTINPIDVIEHKDRLCLISEEFLYISANLQPTVFDDSTDSLQIVVGSGQGKNLALAKIKGNDTLYILNTEGIYALSGDTISALASTFDVRLVDGAKIIARRTAVNVENAIVFLADDYNLWAFDGNSSKKLSHSEKIDDLMDKHREMLDRAVATYYDNYYMLSVVVPGGGPLNNTREIWWDAFEDKIDIVDGRRVSCYIPSDTTVESKFLMFCRSDISMVMWAERGLLFDDEAIQYRLITRAILPKKGINVRFLAFYPELDPIGDRTITFRYFLDARTYDLDDTAKWDQSLLGERKTIGSVNFKNQYAITGRVRPKINYAMGQSITFYLEGSESNLPLTLLGIGMDFIVKRKVKGRKVGQ